jgi:hypothetical protein
VAPPEERSEALLSTPLGRLLVQRLVGQVGLTGMQSLSEGAVMRAAIRCGLDLSPWSTLREELLINLGSAERSLHEAAAFLVSSRVARDWWSNLDRTRQVWIGDGGRPGRAQLQLDLAPFRSSVPKPRRALWTCTEVEDAGSPWMEWLRSGDDRRPGPYHPWRMVPLATARVAEIHSASDWREFVLTCSAPQPHDGRRMPDWHLAAEQWDGVHLSMGGFLTGQAVVNSAQGATTELDGWSFESTVWLRWVFSDVVDLPVIDR